MMSKDVFGVYPFQLGSQAGWVLHDGFLWGEPVQQYAVDVPDIEIAELFGTYFLNPRRIQLGMSPILFRWGTELVLTDTGIGNVGGDPIGLLDRRLSALGIKPEDVKAATFSNLKIRN
jgi:hypothetical protein